MTASENARAWQYLLDVNVASEAFKPEGKANANVLAWLATTLPEVVCLSDITVAEIEAGVEHLLARGRSEDIERARQFRALARETLPREYAGRILPVTSRTWSIWSRLMGVARARGLGAYPVDFLYAAQAEEHGLTLVTRNVKHLTHAGVALLDSFDDR